MPEYRDFYFKSEPGDRAPLNLKQHCEVCGKLKRIGNHDRCSKKKQAEYRKRTGEIK